jgi:hypothetical protein
MQQLAHHYETRSASDRWGLIARPGRLGPLRCKTLLPWQLARTLRQQAEFEVPALFLGL